MRMPRLRPRPARRSAAEGHLESWTLPAGNLMAAWTPGTPGPKIRISFTRTATGTAIFIDTPKIHNDDPYHAMDLQVLVDGDSVHIERVYPW
ncbi:hypothetical protein [Parafrankia elaeagni]|uniref:hypothetical protein n=1 Tax=Parafrankia elaeagni TaxID=222534 RepID=UPI0012B6217D|nr:hypothetical protein [Parafrankia elaeagni]